MDPVPGGNANAYVYALDPINFSDLSGMLSVVYNYGMQDGVGATVLQPTITDIQPSISASRMQGSYAETLHIRAVVTSTRALSPAIAAVQHAMVVAAPGSEARHATVAAPESGGPNEGLLGHALELAKSGALGCAEGALVFSGTVWISKAGIYASIAEPEAFFAGAIGSCVGAGLFSIGTDVLTGEDYPQSLAIDARDGFEAAVP